MYDGAAANVPKKSAFVRPPRRSNARVAFKLGNLAGDRPNSTSRGRDKHHIARLERGDLQKAAPSCQTRHTGDAQERLRQEPQCIELLHGPCRRGGPPPPPQTGTDAKA